MVDFLLAESKRICYRLVSPYLRPVPESAETPYFDNHMSDYPLNPSQQAAAAHSGGPMLVIAGAGTGKTTVIVERIAALLREGHALPGEILALTFSNEAAENIRARVAQKSSAPDLQVNTFHSYCFNLLKRNHVTFDVLEKEDLWIHLRKNIEKLPLDKYLKASDPAKFLADFLEFFSRCHDELVDCHKYAEYVQQLRRNGNPELPRVTKAKQAAELSGEDVILRCEEVARVYAAIEALLAEGNFATFGATIVRAVQLLRDNPLVLEEERKRARFILIDEFQDCNTAQIELAGLLGGEAQNVFAVGDPDQAVYRFRGASSGAFIHFKQRFPRAREVTLGDNQRSTPAILHCAYTAIQKNPAALPAFAGGKARLPLVSARHVRHVAENGVPAGRQPSPQQNLGFNDFPDPAVQIALAGTTAEQAAHVAESILALRRETGAQWNDFAVLYRTNGHSEVLIRELARRGIPFDLAGANLLETGILRDLLAVLRCLDSLVENVSLFRLALMPQFGIDLKQLQQKMRGAERGTPLVKILEDSDAGKQLVAKIMAARAKFQTEASPIGQVLPKVISEFGFDPARAEIEALQKFADTWEEKPLTRTRGLREFLDYLGWYRRAAGVLKLEKRPPTDVVRLLTIHSSKGLEFRHVFVVRVNSNSFPTNYKQPLLEFPHALRRLSAETLAGFTDDKELHQEEERRLFYVAMTRAKDTLTITGPTAKGKERVPSRFLRDLVADCPADADKNSALNLFDVSTALPRDTAPPASAPRPAASNGVNGQSAANGSHVNWLTLAPAARAGSLSASAIETYDRCPLQFKIGRDWNIPAELSGALQYGSVMHGVLKDYYESVQDHRPHSVNRVLEIFKLSIKNQPFEDAYQQQLYEKQGIEELSAFIAARQQEPPPTIRQIESSFRIDVKGNMVTGRFDRVDEGSHGGVVIVDYKTGSPKGQKKADDSVQLSVYALAAEKVWKSPPERLVYYNLEDNSVVETTRCDADLRKVEEKIAEVADGIRREEFAPKPGIYCTWCGYKMLCPATEERLYGIHSATGKLPAHMRNIE